MGSSNIQQLVHVHMKSNILHVKSVHSITVHSPLHSSVACSLPPAPAPAPPSTRRSMPLTMAQQPLKWGFFGAGRITYDFVNSLHSLPQTNHLPIAIAARDLQRAQDFATRTKLPKAFGEYKELAADPEIDIIYIATVNSEHYDQINLAITHGKHVLCEKPLCLNSRQAKDVVRLARERKVFLMEGYFTRFVPAFRYLEEYIKKGALGDVKLMVSGHGQPIDDYRLSTRELGGGVTLNYGVYGIQYAIFFFGKPDQIVACGHLTETGVDQDTIVNLLYDNGQKSVVIVACTKSRAPPFQLYGEKGSLKLLDHAFAPIQVETTSEGTKTFEMPDIGVKYRSHPYGQLFTYEAEEVRTCIRNGKLESERMSLDDSILIAEITDEVRRQLGVVYPQEETQNGLPN